MDTNIIFQINEKERKIIEEAAKVSTIGHSTFCRIAAVKAAREILKENPTEGSN
jgi:uncharacterized protein (DUF1778 family)